MHPRTLQRELRRSGYLFKQLLTDTRVELARTYLRESDLPLYEIAELLGYRNESAFSRAFKTQFGLSPLKWRKANCDR